jgi:hypothetical protein
METKYLVFYYSDDGSNTKEIVQPGYSPQLIFVNTPPVIPRVGEFVGFLVDGPKHMVKMVTHEISSTGGQVETHVIRVHLSK